MEGGLLAVMGGYYCYKTLPTGDLSKASGNGHDVYLL